MTRAEYRRVYAREKMRVKREKEKRMQASARHLARIKNASDQVRKQYAAKGVKLTRADALHILFLSWDVAA